MDRQHGELLRAFASLAVTLVVMAILLFGAAGTLAWSHGQAFMLVFLLLIFVSIAVLWRLNPEIFVARARLTGQGIRVWDRALLAILLPAFAAILPVAGLDDGRFHRAPAAGIWVVAGYVLLVIGFAGSGWAQAVNRHFEPSVRIQTERHHRVVDTGPYAYVRHPGYVFGSLLAIGRPGARLMVGRGARRTRYRHAAGAYRARGRPPAARPARLRRNCRAHALSLDSGYLVGLRPGRGHSSGRRSGRRYPRARPIAAAGPAKSPFPRAPAPRSGGG